MKTLSTKSLLNRIRKLEHALSWYANPENYAPGSGSGLAGFGASAVEWEGGEMARLALENDREVAISEEDDVEGFGQ